MTAASFELVTEGIADAARSIASATATAGTPSATLTLASSHAVGANATLAVKVLACWQWHLRPAPETGYNRPIIHTTATRRRSDETANP